LFIDGGIASAIDEGEARRTQNSGYHKAMVVKINLPLLFIILPLFISDNIQLSFYIAYSNNLWAN